MLLPQTSAVRAVLLHRDDASSDDQRATQHNGDIRPVHRGTRRLTVNLDLRCAGHLVSQAFAGKGLENWKPSNAKDLSWMSSWAAGVSNLDISGWDVSGAEVADGFDFMSELKKSPTFSVPTEVEV